MSNKIILSYSTSSQYPEDGNGPLSWTSALDTVLIGWASDGISGTHGEDNPGGFFTNGVGSGLAGDTYAFTTGNGYAFSVYGDMSYNISTHVLAGDITSISFGGSLAANGTVNNPFMDITFDAAITDDATVHDVVWGLMNADVQPLLDLMASDYGVDITDTLEQLADNSSALVGVAEFDDALLAA